MAFPPVPVYPNAYDSDYTLYNVYNSSESKLSVDNQAWSSEIDIVPATVNEIWPSNGYATLNGEIIYYDAVGTSGGFVNKLKRCARNLGGTKTQFNPAGTNIRGFVMAEHHKQLVTAIINTERFISTVASRISLLESLPQCPDDANCPSIALHLGSNLPSATCLSLTNQCIEISNTYSVAVAGSYDTLQVDFGNGQVTTALTGTYNTGQGTPIVTAINAQCTTVTTGAQTFTPSTATIPSPYIETFTVPDIPPFAIPTFAPPMGFTMPQIPGPCIDLSPLNALASFAICIPKISIPNISLIVPSIPNISLIVPSIPNISLIVPKISIPNISVTLSIPSLTNISLNASVNIPSVISITPVNIPSVISFGPVDIPSFISFGPVNIPSFISITPVSLPSTITIVGISHITIDPITGISNITIDPITGISNVTVGAITGISTVTVGNIGGISTVTVQAIGGISTVTVGAITGISTVTVQAIGGISNVTVGAITGISYVNVGNIGGISNVTVGNIGGISNVTVQAIGGISNVTVGAIVGISNVTVGAITGISHITIDPVSVNWQPVPTVSVVWGNCNCAVTVSCAAASSAFAPALDFADFQDGFNLQANLEPNDIGIPSEINVVFPEIMPEIKVDFPAIPDILMKLEKPLPREIKITGVPETLKLDATDMPSSIRLDTSSLPGVISLIPQNIPDVISIDGSDLPRTIKVEGIPSVIELKAPEFIPLRLPENVEIPLVYKGGPIPVTFDVSNFMGTASDAPRFVILPAPCPQA